jgi:hypothetical protein
LGRERQKKELARLNRQVRRTLSRSGRGASGSGSLANSRASATACSNSRASSGATSASGGEQLIRPANFFQGIVQPNLSPRSATCRQTPKSAIPERLGAWSAAAPLVASRSKIARWIRKLTSQAGSPLTPPRTN